MYSIDKQGWLCFRRERLISDAKLTRSDFATIAATRRGSGKRPFKARKTAVIAARQLAEPTAIETRWQGELTVNQAAAGDWLVVRLEADRSPARDSSGNFNLYVIKPAEFADRYVRIDGELADPKLAADGTFYFYEGGAQVEAMGFDGGLDIVAPWGGRQSIDGSAYLLLSGDEVYGNAAPSFEADYKRL